MPNPPPKDDVWAWNEIETPFPDNPTKVIGEQNQYVALWYKNGRPCHGRAWNDGGVVKCSFAYPVNKSEMTKKSELQGQIQILQYKGNHLSLGYWYNWIKYQDRPEIGSADKQLVRCGNSIPILWQRPEGAILGFLNMSTEVASFAADGKYYSKEGGQLKDFLIIVRELKGGPNGCECAECLKGPVTRVMLNEWADFCVGDPFPAEKAIRALGRSLDTLPGEKPDQYIALWYQQGEPVMGRIWNEGGKIAANFGWGGHEYKGQILFEMSERVRGFDYGWKDFKEAALFGEKEWYPVHVNNWKGDISPGVLIIDGKEVLGKVDVRNERASIGYAGSEKVLSGPAVHSCKVLCRKAKPGCTFDETGN
ncbi:MFP2b [Aphelenchoides bicaudatus]|nr:MFP2b [Aphelenchoides bicaudatus]